MHYESTQSVLDQPGASVCSERKRLMDAFLKVVGEIAWLISEQTRAVIDGDDEFMRFDLLLEDAQQRRREAKYALMAHIERHPCCSPN